MSDQWIVLISAEHLTSWMTGLNLHSHCLRGSMYPGMTFKLYLLTTDLYLRTISERAPLFSGLKTEGLPAKFDWRDKAVVAPVQNQQAVRITQIDGYRKVGTEIRTQLGYI